MNKCEQQHEFGICKITCLPCPELGVCHITENYYKPLPNITLDTINAQTSYELADYDSPLYPNWQCVNFKRSDQSEDFLHCPMCGVIVTYIERRYWCNTGGCGWNSRFKPHKIAAEKQK